MKIIKVKSSQFKFIAFEGKPDSDQRIEGTLRVYFPNAAYEYKEIAGDTVIEMLFSGSTGSYFIREIKPHFTIANGRCEKLEGDALIQSAAELREQWDTDIDAQVLIAKYAPPVSTTE